MGALLGRFRERPTTPPEYQVHLLDAIKMLEGPGGVLSKQQTELSNGTATQRHA